MNFLMALTDTKVDPRLRLELISYIESTDTTMNQIIAEITLTPHSRHVLLVNSKPSLSMDSS